MRRLDEHFGSLESAWEASYSGLLAVSGIGEQTAAAVVKDRRRIDPETLLAQHQQTNPNFWTLIDADYPRWLREIPDSPPVLYYQGQIAPLESEGLQPAVAIVGTRKPSDYGRRWARRLSIALAQAGVTVVSGLAEGIDTEAHQSCLEAGGRTIAVVGTGLDIVYPQFNRRLAEQIARQGLVLSEYAAGTPPDRGHFPRRNRIIAGLCRATLVIEAPQKSGSLITARQANEYGREVYALPGTLDNPLAGGCLSLIAQGAQVILGESELLEMLGTLPPLLKQPDAPAQLSFLSSAAIPDLEPELQQVFQAVGLEPTAVDLIVQNTGLATGAVLSALAQLEIMSLISQLPGMRYQRG